MFKVSGLEEMGKALKEMLDKAPDFLGESIDSAGDVVLKNIQRHAPGNLKNGLTMSKKKMVSRYTSRTISLKKGYAYGIPVELGHQLYAWGHKTDRQIKERPFMRPGADESMEDVEKILLAGLDKVLEKFGG